MYIFAKNAVDLPDNPSQYQVDIAYVSNPTAAFIQNGFSSNTLVETSQLNQYLKELTSIIDDWIKNGIIIEIQPDFTMNDPQEDDLKRNPINPTELLIFKNNSWKSLLAEATDSDKGFIDISKILSSNNPIDNYIGKSTHDNVGAIPINSFMTIQNFNDMTTIHPTFVDDNSSLDDDNDFGNSNYFGSNISLNVSPNRETSKFLIKHFGFPSNTSTIIVDNIPVKPQSNDFYIDNSGNIIGG
jgi:hypothetical protein